MDSDRAAPRVSRDELLAMTPEIIRQALPKVPWDIRKLWALDRPVRRVAVADLECLFGLPLWQLDGRRFQVSPGLVRAEPGRFPDHMRRVMAADLENPVHLVEHKGRLARAARSRRGQAGGVRPAGSGRRGQAGGRWATMCSKAATPR
jgi:hypothetical protein